MTRPNNKNPLRRPGKNLPPRNRPPNNNWLLASLLLFSLMIFLSRPEAITKINAPKELPYSEFYALLKENNTTGRIQKLELIQGRESELFGTYNDGSQFRLYMPINDEQIFQEIRANVKDFSVRPAQTFWAEIITGLLPFILIFLLLWFVSYRGSQMGNKIWSFGKSRAKVNSKNDQNITFNDVAGVDEAKEELQEVIEFLKEPKRFQRLGGKIPKGVLLVGQPGTGKTLLARAVAGEAGVPFFSLSGSDFVEMFVGVGASRVRDLFDQARRASKTSGKGAIVFIDEIDAVGRLRFAGIGGGNDEREQTLNALLVEMDGFNTQTGTIVIAATNRPDTLDPALLRPGRFDRQIVVGLPDIIGREEILKVHSRHIKLDPAVDFKKIAQQTVYFSGADLANVCNEAALLAARRDKETVGMAEMLAAVERVTMGPEKKSRTVSKKENEITAYHEAGHALLSLLVHEVDTFSKVSIIPRGMAGGYTLTPPKEDRHYRNKKELKGTMVVLLGGLVAEEIVLNDTSTGVSNDLEKVTQIARAMICDYGMNDTLGRMAFGNHQKHHFLGRDLWENKDFSEETAKQIDMEIRKIVEEAYQRAKSLLSANRDKLDLIANRLLDKETIDIDEARALLGMSGPSEKISHSANATL
ncbi:MAG: ATP-dependent zinc metalloprotease FtsH [Candidatus Omnitrophota bacterium]|nr:ATP-dependent zinc metalloprotease FtsH [Candidatus Omnitrophota bacterium]MDZ4242199.1 ATP-dependent zinc metalloprotease FtsH [Candidatus Omnitrophota bacterium]